MFSSINFGKTPRVRTTQRDQQAVKKIVEPFLQWHNSLFSFQEETIKKLADHSKLVEDSLGGDGGFEVNEETLLNILSAELQGSSKVQSFHTFKILPTVPASIAERTNLQKETYSYKLNESCKQRVDNKGIVMKVRYVEATKAIDESEYLISNDFADTEDLCKHLKQMMIVERFVNNSIEYREYTGAEKMVQ